MAFVGGHGAIGVERSGRVGVCGQRRGVARTPERRRRPVACAVSEGEGNGMAGEDDERSAEVLRVLSAVMDPDLGKDIVTLGFVKNLRYEPDAGKFIVKFDVELTTPACPIKDQFRISCKELVEALPWASRADVTMTAVDATQVSNGALRGVRAVVAVASCKGGVGKSTTAVNLGFALAKAGARVGIMDADIYGPSLPTMVQPESEIVEFEGGLIKPLVYDGVKLMSFGYVNSDSAIMRGPMIANMLTQLLTTTNWGDLDYLVIDMPPGTGDVQLTLSQQLNITASVIVTTPQRLSFVDVVKGIEMFDKVNVPSIAVVENMSYFEAPDTKTRHYIFGSGYTEKLKSDFGIRHSYRMPIDTDLCEKCDTGVPFVVAAPESEPARLYDQIAEGVVREVARIQYGGLSLPKVTHDKEANEIVVAVPGAEEQRIHPAELRRACRCALCIDEMTGRKLLRDEDVREDCEPRSMRAVGNYALEVIWDDGHPSLYPYARFVTAWQETPKEAPELSMV